MRPAGRSVGDERFGRFDFICAPSTSSGHADERAGDPLHRAWVNAKTFGNPTDTFTSPLTFVQGGLDSFLEFGGYAWAAKLFALTTGTRKAGADSFLNHRSLKLGEHAHHLKHGLAARRRGVQALLMQEQVDMEGV